MSFCLSISGTVSLFVSSSWDSSSRGRNTAGSASLTRAGYRGVSRKAFEGLFVAKKPEKTTKKAEAKAEADGSGSGSGAPPPTPQQQAASRASPQEANGMSSFAALMQKKPPGVQTPPSEGLPSQRRPAPRPPVSAQRGPNGSGFPSQSPPVPTQTRQTSSGFPSAMPTSSVRVSCIPWHAVGFSQTANCRGPGADWISVPTQATRHAA